jgi:8-hydroxy-5-deazaflavin:NADPH oxidoreductase
LHYQTAIEMRTKQTIAIIGLGELGKRLGTAFAVGKDRVLLFDKDELEARSLAAQLKESHANYDIEALTCSADACWEADVIILTVANEEQANVANYIREYANQKIVVNTSGDHNEANDLQQLLPHSRIITAFHDLPTRLAGNAINTECNVDGEDADAIEIIAELARLMDFKPVTRGCTKQVSTDETILVG